MRIFTILSFISAAAAPWLSADALPTDHYASSSALSEGNWARVSVEETGMHIITRAMLRNLGFSDIDKVNVYGYGGRMLSEKMDASNPDDLPLVPSVKTADGIVFFAFDNIRWSAAGNSGLTYQHTINPYSDVSYYFISDREIDPLVMEESAKDINSNLTTTFVCRQVHESELEPAGDTGRLVLGEDFRAQNQRYFNFDLPDNVGEEVSAFTRFSSRITNGQGSLTFTFNGVEAPATTKDRIPAVTSSKQMVLNTSILKKGTDIGDKLNFGINFSSSGALTKARLDYIEVEYTRELKLHNGELYFYGKSSLNKTYSIAGCSDQTVIWDITDPNKPVKIKYTLSDGNALFSPISSSEREYVAFNTESVKRAVNSPTKVANQNLHAMESPDILVITPPEYMSAALRFKDLHAKTDSLSVVCLTPQEIYNEFSSGVPDVTAFRKLLKMWYDRRAETGRHAKYCMIMSRPTYDNKMVSPVVRNCGYPRIPIWQSADSYTETSSYSTDDYIGMLDDTKGNFTIGSEFIQVAVGRMPVKSLTEANLAIDKLEKYMLKPDLGEWRNNVMIIADDQDRGVHLTQAEDVYAGFMSTDEGRNKLYERLYLDGYELVSSGSGMHYPQAKDRLALKLEEGLSFIEYIGHGSPTSITHEDLINWTDMTSLTNQRLPFVYAATCEFMRWDDDQVSGGEEIWLNPTAGIIGMICPSREVLISDNGNLSSYTSKYVFKRYANGTQRRVGDFYLDGKNDYVKPLPSSSSQRNNDNKLRYQIIGDPSLLIPMAQFQVAIDSIAGVEMTDNMTTFPELPARGRVEVVGSILDSEGNLLDDFNGVATLTLMDAERVITTLGNGDKGVESTYNDRKTRLYKGRTNVVAGKWRLTVMMPPEIENNYSPALMNVYASDELGREASGFSDQLYVYGYDKNAPEDNDGPEISFFAINSENFTDGQAVPSNPIVLARISDASGINLSEAGIGHGLRLCVDGTTYFNDLQPYYTPDNDNITSGSIRYPLSGVSAGDHTLTLTVWDNANNSSSASLNFSIDVAAVPDISSLSTNVNPAKEDVIFKIGTQQPLTGLKYRLEVFDLNGKTVWSQEATAASAANSEIQVRWDLKDTNGLRVPRGIYPYRVTLETADGFSSSRAAKLAVASE